MLPTKRCFDFITLTNTVHEISADGLATVIIDGILKLAPTGTLFIYDMEQLTSPELGAIPWTRNEAARILGDAVHSLGADNYKPELGRWEHKSVSAWNVQLQRQHLHFSDADGQAQRDEAIHAVAGTIGELLRTKLHDCQRALESLTRFGGENPKEEQQKMRLLFDYWALSRAIGAAK